MDMRVAAVSLSLYVIEREEHGVKDAGCPQSRRCASPACRPFSVDNRYRRCGRARPLRSLLTASSSKLDWTRERTAFTPGQQNGRGYRRDGGGGGLALHGVGGSAHAKEPSADGGQDGESTRSAIQGGAGTAYFAIPPSGGTRKSHKRMKLANPYRPLHLVKNRLKRLKSRCSLHLRHSSRRFGFIGGTEFRRWLRWFRWLFGFLFPLHLGRFC